MDIRSLRYAITLAEELHFGRAAQRHYITFERVLTSPRVVVVPAHSPYADADRLTPGCRSPAHIPN